MKRYLILLSFIIVPMLASGQRYADYGIFVGGASYMGDLNGINPFFSPSTAAGGFFRLNFNKRWAGRLSGNYVTLAGNPEAYPNLPVVGFNPDFPSALMDFAVQAEFNFLPYMTGEDQYARSLYVAGGLGYTMLLGRGGSFTIPFGIGYKFNVTPRLAVGAEMSFRKTFTDQLDNVSSVLGNSLINNNDWYSVYGLFISYKFVKFAADCPAYR
ncbi:MAG: hypothetical protein JW801_04735 [Bacteroidales bacterium]|nr:hypothetical protein [Bacteroidales bacterium]